MSEVRTISKKTAFMFFHFFSIPVPVQVRICEPVHVKKKRVELNQTALLGGDIYTDLRVDLAMTGAINVQFFLWTILQKGSERCVLIDFDLQNCPSPVLWR